jgi:hypothetical protein
MQKRKPLAPNNRKVSLTKAFKGVGGSRASYAKDQRIVSWPNTGRQNSEGFGGGYRVLRKGQ